MSKYPSTLFGWDLPDFLKGLRPTLRETENAMMPSQEHILLGRFEDGAFIADAAPLPVERQAASQGPETGTNGGSEVQSPGDHDSGPGVGLPELEIGNIFQNYVFGSSNADHLHGTGVADIIFGLGGDDLIHGGDDNDQLFGATALISFTVTTATTF